MALADIFAAVESEPGLVAAGITFRDGGEYLGVQDVPPRIVWVPTDERLGPPESHWVGGPRPLAERQATVEAHIWGANRAACEALIPVFVNALRAKLGAGYRFGAGRWPVQDAKVLGQLGRCYVLPVTFFIPVVVAEGTGTVTTADATDVAISVEV